MSRLVAAMLSVPWLCTQEYTQVLFDIAGRLLADEGKAAELRAARAERPGAVAMRGGTRVDGTRGATVRDGVAVLPVLGGLVRRADLFDEMSGATSTGSLARDLGVLLDAREVDAILLEIDSPGGEAFGINELAAQIYAGRERKPIWAYVDGMAASAAYWLASAAERIVADDLAGLGSIGAVMAVYDPAKLNTKQIEFVSSQSPNKRADPNSEKGKAQYQKLVDDLADVFIESIAAYRGVTVETVHEQYGQGAVLIGRHAVSAGLADQLGSFEQTLIDLRALALDRRAAPERPARAHAQGVSPMAGESTKGGAPADDVEQRPTGAETTQAAELKALREQVAQMKATARLQSATTFAERAVANRRVMPAAKDGLAAVYLRLAAADELAPPKEGEKTGVDMLAALVDTLPQHALTRDTIPANTRLQALEPRTSTDGVESDDEIDAQVNAYVGKTDGRNGQHSR